MPKPRSIRRRVVAAGGLMAAAFATAASAYILPSSSILRRMSESRNELQISNLRIDGTLTFAGSSVRSPASSPGGGSSRSDAQVDAVLLLKLPARCRFEASAPEGARSVTVWSHGKERTEGTRLEELVVALGQVCPLLAVRSASEAGTRATLERHLSAMKIDARTTSLGRLGGQIAYVLGNPAEGQPQLWIYKDGFLPARVRWADVDRKRWDVRFLDYGSPLTGEAFPRVLELYRDDDLLLRFSGLRSDSRATLAERLF